MITKTSKILPVMNFRTDTNNGPGKSIVVLITVGELDAAAPHPSPTDGLDVETELPVVGVGMRHMHMPQEGIGSHHPARYLGGKCLPHSIPSAVVSSQTMSNNNFYLIPIKKFSVHDFHDNTPLTSHRYTVFVRLASSPKATEKCRAITPNKPCPRTCSRGYC